MRSDTFCLSNNSEVEVIRSLLLVHCVLLPRAVCLFLCVIHCNQENGSSISSIPCFLRGPWWKPPKQVIWSAILSMYFTKETVTLWTSTDAQLWFYTSFLSSFQLDEWNLFICLLFSCCCCIKTHPLQKLLQYRLHSCNERRVDTVYINSVRTSQETQYISVLHPGTLTTRSQRRFTFFYITYINSVRTS
jgi:hypothetical protein